MLTKEQARAAYGRVRDWEQRQFERLNNEILIPHFGRCSCRMHNCIVNYESGRCETPDNPNKHWEQVQLAKLYGYRERKIWDTANRLQAAFARYL